MGPLFARLSVRKANIYRLVLSASRIPHQTVRQNTFWGIDVPASHRRAAVTAISLYLAENADAHSSNPVFENPFIRTYSAVYAMIILLVIHWAVQSGYEQQEFIKAFGADSTAIINGQVYRCVTALLFHNDWSHLLSNLFGLAIFGTGAAATCGWGMGWLLTLAAGSLGNLINALWYGSGHISVGASTAVFAAVGLCAVLNFGVQIRRSQRLWRAWIPLGAGLALLAFLGASPQTDLMAHLFGFGAGLLLGGLYTWRIQHPLSWPGQLVSLLIASGAVVVCWMVGLSGS